MAPKMPIVARNKQVAGVKRRVRIGCFEPNSGGSSHGTRHFTSHLGPPSSDRLRMDAYVARYPSSHSLEPRALAGSRGGLVRANRRGHRAPTLPRTRWSLGLWRASRGGLVSGASVCYTEAQSVATHSRYPLEPGSGGDRRGPRVRAHSLQIISSIQGRRSSSRRRFLFGQSRDKEK